MKFYTDLIEKDCFYRVSTGFFFYKVVEGLQGVIAEIDGLQKNKEFSEEVGRELMKVL